MYKRSAKKLFFSLSNPSSSRIDKPKTSLLIELKDTPGSLQEALKFFWKYDINMTHIESRPTKGNLMNYNFNVDFDGKIGDNKTDNFIKELKKNSLSVLVLSEREVPWFPRKIADLDMSISETLDANTDLESDHPGFLDKEYRKRRNELTEIAKSYVQGGPIPYINYTKSEIATWGVVYNRMKSLWKEYACKEFNYILPLLKENCNYNENNIPQQEDISTFLKEYTGFTLRPVCGLLSSRDFLNGLAFRVFFSTQYLRHPSRPLYTPEPDICHELMGHAPMFADPEFADFSHEIGLASLGASDEEIQKLAACYWFSVEFGLCKQNGKIKAYGAGLLSSFGELEYACSSLNTNNIISEIKNNKKIPELRPWNPKEACKQTYPITTYQPIYYVAESLGDAKERMRIYCEDIKKPFYAKYDPFSQTIIVDRALKLNTKVKKTL